MTLENFKKYVEQKKKIGHTFELERCEKSLEANLENAPEERKEGMRERLKAVKHALGKEYKDTEKSKKSK